MPAALFLGLDFGTESVRAVLVNPRGRTSASAVASFRHGQITPGSASAATLGLALPEHFALQHPGDWFDSAASAVRRALAQSGADASNIQGIGIDFTSCTMLPCRADGSPMCCRRGPVRINNADAIDPTLATVPHAWPKLWKHHGALDQTDRLNRAARDRCEPWLARYGGVIGIEWFFPKMLEVIEQAPEIASATDVWLEAGDWFVWQMTTELGRRDPATLPRSTCQAGYKALWSAPSGYPGEDYLKSVNPALAEARRSRLPGRFIAPGRAAGGLSSWAAAALGLREGTPVSTAIIDAHAGVPGAGVAEPGTLVMVLGTSGCHMLLADSERLIPGVAGVVQDGILPGFYGYETGQAAMGDAFDLARRLTGHHDFAALDAAARALPPGSGGVVALDWFNGCRTPLMDGSLRGGFLGLTLSSRPEHLYRATLEASALGLRWIVETLRSGGVPVNKFVATGGLPGHNPLFIDIIASALGADISIHAAPNGPALGAAILGSLAAGKQHGGYDHPAEAVASMAGAASELPTPRAVKPDASATATYDPLYRAYRKLADEIAAPASALRQLSALSHDR